MMVNGRIELFSNVSSMVIQWEKEEESLLGMVEPGNREPRRRIQGVNELCSKFEPIEEEPEIRLNVDARGRGVGGELLSGRGIEMTENEMNLRIFGSDGRLVEQKIKPTHARLIPVEKVLKISTL